MNGRTWFASRGSIGKEGQNIDRRVLSLSRLGQSRQDLVDTNICIRPNLLEQHNSSQYSLYFHDLAELRRAVFVEKNASASWPNLDVHLGMWKRLGNTVRTSLEKRAHRQRANRDSSAS